MDIINANAGLITNLEVLNLIKGKNMERYPSIEDFEELLDSAGAVKSGHANQIGDKSYTKEEGWALWKRWKALENAVWLKAKVTEYLEGTPAGSQDPASIKRFLTAYKSMGVKLTPAELLQLINLRPSSLVEIYKIVEECPERLSEEQSMKLLEVVGECLPEPPEIVFEDQDSDEEEEGEGDEGDEGENDGQGDDEDAMQEDE